MDRDLVYKITNYYQRRGLKWPSADRALDFCLTELAEAKEVIIDAEGGWTRNNPDRHTGEFDQKWKYELGDIIMMAMVAGIVTGVDPIAALLEKMERKLKETEKE